MDQVRGDTETTFPEEMRNRLCLCSLQQPHGQHTLTLSKFVVNYPVCGNLIRRQSISKLFHYVQLIRLCRIFNILVKLRNIFSPWFQYFYNFINISEISFLITVMIGMFLKIISGVWSFEKYIRLVISINFNWMFREIWLNKFVIEV